MTVDICDFCGEPITRYDHPGTRYKVRREQNLFEVPAWEYLTLHDDCWKMLGSFFKENGLPVVKKAHWNPVLIPTGVSAFGVDEMTAEKEECSECHARYGVEVHKNFCPNCGSMMVSKEKENPDFRTRWLGRWVGIGKEEG